MPTGPRTADKPIRKRPDVVPLQLLESDADVVRALLAGRATGGAALYDRHHVYVRRVLTRVLGPDTQLDDVLQDVFLIAIDSIERLEDPEALRSWLASIAVHRARGEIRKRTRQRWLATMSWNAREAAPPKDPSVTDALRATYRVLDRLPADERVAFALRYIEGMELVEVASATQVSLATIKRRLRRAQDRFVALARQYPVLTDWVRGARWT